MQRRQTRPIRSNIPPEVCHKRAEMQTNPRIDTHSSRNKFKLFKLLDDFSVPTNDNDEAYNSQVYVENLEY